MKRVRPVNPGLPNIAREEMDLRSRSRDSRRDPQATAKISKAELEEVLSRSNSGMRAAVRPETTDHARTQSGERVAVRPGETARADEKVSSDRPTARPAAIEVGDTHESQSDRLADEMYRAVQARVAAQPTLVHAPFTNLEPPPAPSVAATIPDAPESGDLGPREHEDPVAIRVQRMRAVASLVMLTIVLAAIAWYAGRWVGVLLQHS